MLAAPANVRDGTTQLVAVTLSGTGCSAQRPSGRRTGFAGAHRATGPRCDSKRRLRRLAPGVAMMETPRRGLEITVVSRHGWFSTGRRFGVSLPRLFVNPILVKVGNVVTDEAPQVPVRSAGLRGPESRADSHPPIFQRFQPARALGRSSVWASSPAAFKKVRT